jgi:hypothetical protein
MSAREYLMIVKESALGTVVANPVAGTDAIYVRLIDGNAFTMVADPVIEEVPYGGGFAVTAEAISDHYECKGQLKTKLYPSQAALLLGWAITRVGASPQAPWATTEPVGDLASCSVYHAVRNSDGTYGLKRYAGCKVAGWRVEVSRQSTTAVLTLDLVAAQEFGNAMEGTADPTADEFPAPQEGQYPVGPYTFKQTAGQLSVGSVRSQYESLAIAGRNALDGRWFESAHLQVVQSCGRSTTLDAALMLKSTPDDRSAYEALAAQSCSVGFNTGGAGTNLTLAFNGQNTITKLPYDLPLNQVFLRKLSLKNRWDPSANSGAGGDIAVSFSASTSE